MGHSTTKTFCSTNVILVICRPHVAHLLVCGDDILPFSRNEISLCFLFLCRLLYFLPSHHQPEGHFVPAATQHNNLNLT